MMPSASKKRKLAGPDTISFDFSAREDYLTGFHKRKVARIKHAQEESAKKEREDRIRVRAELRKKRKENLEKHIDEVNRLVKQANGNLTSSDEDSNNELDHAEQIEVEQSAVIQPEEVNEKKEYIDEDKYTIVTVESVDISKLGFEIRNGEGKGKDESEQDEASKKVWTKEKPKSNKPKRKKIKFRYETKAERKAERVKQGVRKKKMREKREKD